jgi:hypothetical protein
MVDNRQPQELPSAAVTFEKILFRRTYRIGEFIPVSITTDDGRIGSKWLYFLQ